jgi:general secretion pathway protein J
MFSHPDSTMADRQHRGFTLLELLVAMGIFAVIGAMALGGLNAITGQTSQAALQAERLAGLQRAVRQLTADVGAAAPRYGRDELGAACEEPPFVADGRLGVLLQLTRGGWPNPANLPHRGTLQRVQYRLEDGTLIREYWPVLNHVLGEKPRAQVLLSGVTAVRLQFLDAGQGPGEWASEWPPLSRSETSLADLPRAVQIKLDLEDWGVIERLVEVAR